MEGECDLGFKDGIDNKAQAECVLRYTEQLEVHINNVQKACIAIGGIPSDRIEKHDESKYYFKELMPYAFYFFGEKAGLKDDGTWKSKFDEAFLHHVRENPHHWEHWVVWGRDPVFMPEIFVREMLADWLGANKTYQGIWRSDDWIAGAMKRIKLHPDSMAILEKLVGELPEIYAKLEKEQS